MKHEKSNFVILESRTRIVVVYAIQRLMSELDKFNVTRMETKCHSKAVAKNVLFALRTVKRRKTILFKKPRVFLSKQTKIYLFFDKLDTQKFLQQLQISFNIIMSNSFFFF